MCRQDTLGLVSGTDHANTHVSKLLSIEDLSTQV